MVTGGHNLGRIGTLVHREKHPGSFDIVHVKDSTGHTFATRLSNVFIIGQVKLHRTQPAEKTIHVAIFHEAGWLIFP